MKGNSSNFEPHQEALRQAEEQSRLLIESATDFAIIKLLLTV
jgi:hypothetical protein